MINKNILTILEKLDTGYPQAKIALNYSNVWELLVAVILSAQCTDTLVNKVTPSLFKKYPEVRDMADCDLNELELMVKSTGFFRNKARNIKAAAHKIMTVFNGRVPDSMENLLLLPGVARKTANIVLGNGYGKVEGIAVDTHVSRLSQRLRIVDIEKLKGRLRRFVPGKDITDFIKDANTDEIESGLMKLIPKNRWHKFTYQIIDHGRTVCKAHNPVCGQCFLAAYCPAAR